VAPRRSEGHVSFNGEFAALLPWIDRRMRGRHGWRVTFHPLHDDEPRTAYRRTITPLRKRARIGSAGITSVSFAAPEESALDQPKCSVTDSSNALIPFQAICTPIQTRKNDDNCVITVMPVAPRIRANRSANP